AAAVLALWGKKGGRAVVRAVAGSQFVAAVVRAVQEAEKGRRGQAALKAVGAEATRAVGKSLLERVSGFSKDLWNDVRRQHGTPAAVVASGAYILLNKGGLAAQVLAVAPTLGLSVGPGMAAARSYAVYYAVKGAADVVGAAADGARKAVAAGRPAAAHAEG